MRRVTSNLFAQNQPFFEYYTNTSPNTVPHSNKEVPNDMGGVAFAGHSRLSSEDRFDHMSESMLQKSKERDTLNSPPINGSPVLSMHNYGSSEKQLTSHEKRRYRKALKDIYDTVKNQTQTLEINSDTTQSEKDIPVSDFVLSSLNTRKKAVKLKNKKKLTEVELQEIYQELRVISEKLKEETQELQLWEESLYEREALLNDEGKISKQILLFEDELERRCAELEEEYQASMKDLQTAYVEKSKEANRLRDSFNTIRNAHDELRKQFLDIQDKNRVLESQTLSLQQRLNNLLRKNEHKEKQLETMKLVKHGEKSIDISKRSNEDSIKAAASPKINISGILDVLASLLIWVSDFQLGFGDQNSEEKPGVNDETISKEHVYGKCVKILPPLADMLPCLPTINPNVVYPLLKFLYSVMLYMDESHHSKQKPVLASTLRRIGEELYKPEPMKQPDNLSLETKKGGKRKNDVYLRSANIEERILSTLIVLKTTTRADFLAHTFDFLKTDLREEIGKKLFIRYNGISVILPFFKQKTKTFLDSAVDVILQMSMESGVVSDFLTSCSASNFFNVCSSLMQDKGFEIKILEKLSIVLQRLSKIRSNRRYFEAFQFIPLLQDLLRQHDTQNAFLSLNIRSILVNLNASKTV